MKAIPFALPSTGKEEIKAVKKAITSNWLTTGRLTQQFEEAFAKKIQKPYTLAVNSATAGLHLALEAVGIAPDDKVIVPSYTFAATAEVVRYQRAIPLFADILPDSPLIDPAEIEKLAKQKGVKAVIVVHYAGQSCDMQAILSLCKKYNLFCIEDAAHAFSAYKEDSEGNHIYLGTQGDIGVYSFYATKTITTGEGGMVVTSHPQFYERMKVMRLHGIDRTIWNRYTDTKASWEYDVVAPGFKYNLTDIASAIGLAQLKKSDFFYTRRKEIALQYFEGFRQLEEKGLIELPQNDFFHSWHLFPIQIQSQKDWQKNHRKRTEMMQSLAKRGIGLSVHYKPLHMMSYYKTVGNYQPEDLPNTLDRYSRSFSLPIYPSLKKSQIRYIIKEIIRLIENGS